MSELWIKLLYITLLDMVKRTQKHKLNKRKTLRSKRRGGAAGVWKYDRECVHRLFDMITNDVIGNFLPERIGSIESENTRVTDNVVELGGRGSLGSTDQCEFVLDSKTGKITYKALEPENTNRGNEWDETQENIILFLDSCKRLVVANNKNKNK